jgi:Uma2 family endonuclease
MPTARSGDARLTYEDFLLFPDDGQRHELIDGVHYVTPSPNRRHQALLGRLHLAIGGFLARNSNLGQVFLSPFDVVLSNHDVVEPDLLFIARDQETILTEQNVQGAPALVVEIFSPSTQKRDRTIKRALFDARGVREYWMVDPEERSVTVYRRDRQGSLDVTATLTLHGAAATLTTPLLPGFSLDMSTLFAES